jgi:hypothetical protein
MIQMLYAKALRISSGVKSEMGVGSIVNLQSNDASKIWNLPMYLHIVWNGPFQVWREEGGVRWDGRLSSCLCPLYELCSPTPPTHPLTPVTLAPLTPPTPAPF